MDLKQKSTMPIATVVLLALSLGSAQAAEPTKTKAPHDWSGAYAGVTLGGAWDTSTDDRDIGADRALPPNRTVPDARREAVPPAIRR